MIFKCPNSEDSVNLCIYTLNKKKVCGGFSLWSIVELREASVCTFEYVYFYYYCLQAQLHQFCTLGKCWAVHL